MILAGGLAPVSQGHQMQTYSTENQPDCQQHICRECGYDVPPTAIVCPMCGLLIFRINPEWQRARAIIRHHAPRVDLLPNLRRRVMSEPYQVRRRVPVNRLLLNYWQAVKQAKELVLSGYSERRIAAIQGMSKTAIHNRLLLPFRVLHSEIKRITAWLTPTPPVVSISIGIDRLPTPSTMRPTERTIRTRYGLLTYRLTLPSK